MRIPMFLPLPGDALATPEPSWIAIKAAALLQAWRLWRIERRTVAELGRLDDATLRDIGITRPELAAGLVREQMLRHRVAGMI